MISVELNKDEGLRNILTNLLPSLSPQKGMKTQSVKSTEWSNEINEKKEEKGGYKDAIVKEFYQALTAQLPKCAFNVLLSKKPDSASVALELAESVLRDDLSGDAKVYAAFEANKKALLVKDFDKNKAFIAEYK